MENLFLIIMLIVPFKIYGSFISSVREVETRILLQLLFVHTNASSMFDICCTKFLVGINIPFEVDDNSLSVGVFARAYYYSTDNATYYTNPSIDFARKMEGGASRWNLYTSLNNFIERSGFGDGKACLLRTICEVAEIPFEQRSGLFAEILHILLTPSSTPEEVQHYTDLEYHAAEKIGKEIGHCETLYSDCSYSLISSFTKLGLSK